MLNGIQFNNKALYLITLLGAGFLLFAAIGPGLISKNSIPFISWQFQIFEILCHQDPTRSYLFNGQQMAVCSRCLGIYSSFVIGILLMPIFALFMELKYRYYFRFLITTIILNLADVIGNFIGLWTNTNMSRFLFGILFGLSTALLLSNEFFKKLTKED